MSGELEHLMRNKHMQLRYNTWLEGIDKEYGSTRESSLLRSSILPCSVSSHIEGRYTECRVVIVLETPIASLETPSLIADTYLTQARLPWSNPSTPHPTYKSSPSTLQPPPSDGPSTSGSSTPSAGFVSLSSLALDSKLRAAQDSLGSKSAVPAYLRYGPDVGLEAGKYAVLPNDWPYNVPYGVRHYCVWSRVSGTRVEGAMSSSSISLLRVSHGLPAERQVPIAHPHLVAYDPLKWSKIESEGLAGFTGVIPSRRPAPISSVRSNVHPDTLTNGVTEDSDHTVIDLPGGGRAAIHSSAIKTYAPKNLVDMPKEVWYDIDVAVGGAEMRQWDGREYETEGGGEVGGMVRGLWDERGWETIWVGRGGPHSVSGPFSLSWLSVSFRQRVRRRMLIVVCESTRTHLHTSRMSGNSLHSASRASRGSPTSMSSPDGKRQKRSMRPRRYGGRRTNRAGRKTDETLFCWLFPLSSGRVLTCGSYASDMSVT